MRLEILARVSSDGSVALPGEVREALGLQPGDEIMLLLEQDSLRLLAPRAAVRRAQHLVRSYVPAGRSLADELIAERRLEAGRE